LEACLVTAFVLHSADTSSNRVLLFHLSPFVFLRRPWPPLFPYTTLFRSHPERDDGRRRYQHVELARLRVGGGDASSDGAEREKRSEEHTSELQSRENVVCRHLVEKKNRNRSSN